MDDGRDAKGDTKRSGSKWTGLLRWASPGIALLGVAVVGGPAVAISLMASGSDQGDGLGMALIVLIVARLVATGLLVLAPLGILAAALAFRHERRNRHIVFGLVHIPLVLLALYALTLGGG